MSPSSVSLYACRLINRWSSLFSLLSYGSSRFIRSPDAINWLTELTRKVNNLGIPKKIEITTTCWFIFLFGIRGNWTPVSLFHIKAITGPKEKSSSISTQWIWSRARFGRKEITNSWQFLFNIIFSSIMHIISIGSSLLGASDITQLTALHSSLISMVLQDKALLTA